jgi:hypothetical protein
MANDLVLPIPFVTLQHALRCELNCTTSYKP